VLTRLRVSGFKNLVDTEVSFGPFTCIAGANGVGKSNLFDAIRFLSALADQPLLEAARSVRDERGRAGDVRSLFHRTGEHYDDTMTFVAETIVPVKGTDDLGQSANASITFLQYTLELAYRSGDNDIPLGSLEITREELVHINRSDARRRLGFSHSKDWEQSVLRGARRGKAFISTTTGDNGYRIIYLHQDGGRGGNPAPRSASNLPRTVLSATNAAESPTALLARREMQSWRLLQLEPSALRRPDEFTATPRLGPDGSGLPATLYRLARPALHHAGGGGRNGSAEPAVYARVARRLQDLIQDVYTVTIDRDEKRLLLALRVVGRDGTSYPARALSDGTLRFLALAVLELDPEELGVLCLEEPENGIHPDRIPAILQLLKDIATDVEEPVGPDNPLRQVIVNTHSPAVVQQVDDDSLLVAEAEETVRKGRRFNRVVFGCLPDTWRENIPGVKVTSRGTLLAYLIPTPAGPHSAPVPNGGRTKSRPSRRVRDREDMASLFADVVDE
jgi:predicted ATPase